MNIFFDRLELRNFLNLETEPIVFFFFLFIYLFFFFMDKSKVI